MNFKKTIKITFLNRFFFKSKSRSFLFLYFIFSFFIFDISKAESNDLINSKSHKIDIEYLDSRNELEDYIIDTGDVLSIDFQFEMFNGNYSVNEEGELFLPEIDETYVRGLTTSELTKLLNEKYSKFLIEPDIKLRIAIFKSIGVSISGEVRNPGFYRYPAYKSVSGYRSSSNIISKNRMNSFDSLTEKNNNKLKKNNDLNVFNESTQNIFLNRSTQNINTIADVIFRAGGITSSTDLSRIQIIRDVPLGKGGGKKTAFIDFNSYVKESDPTKNIRIFDGDSLFFPKLSTPNPNQISESVLVGLSPKFIKVNLFGRVENPGILKLPLEATLSDAIDLSGPIKPLSGKIVLIRYEKDGTYMKRNIAYSATAKKGSKKNPYLKEDDLISVKESILGKTTSVIKEFTSPFLGIYSTKELIENF